MIGESIKRPQVSVIITTRNRARFVEEALKSVLPVTRPTFDLEIIVVDDGSSDNTPEVVQRYPITYLRTKGIGMAGARNLGIQAATGEFITLLDDDDTWLPRNVVTQLEVFAQHPEYGAVHAQAQMTDQFLVPFGEPIPRGKLTSGWIFEQLLTYWPQVGTIVARADVAREVGGLDPTLPGDTDWDWILRIAARYPMGRVAEPVMLFRQRGTPDEDLSWRRFPAMLTIYRRHTAGLSLKDKLRLRPILWKHLGWWAAVFLNYARQHASAGRRRRAFRSLYYAFRCSPAHALVGCFISFAATGMENR